jgi:hypothetical protein
MQIIHGKKCCDFLSFGIGTRYVTKAGFSSDVTLSFVGELRGLKPIKKHPMGGAGEKDFWKPGLDLRPSDQRPAIECGLFNPGRTFCPAGAQPFMYPGFF